MKLDTYRFWLLGSACFASLTLSHAASAQQVDASGAAQEQSSEGSLQEIIVTAQKRSESLQNVPIAVTALSEGQLGGASINGQLDLPKLTPNLNFTLTSTFAAAYIRGVGTQFANAGLESSVSVYLDDLYVPRATAGLFSFNDIERIEVLKGPQGTLYGRNATGGAIRVITKDPQPEFQVAGGATFGSYGRMEFNGMINIPIADGVALRLAAKHDENDGYVRNLAPTRTAFTPLRFQDRNEELYNAKLLIGTGPLTIKISGDYETKNDNEGNAFKALFPRGPEQIGLAFGGCNGDGGFYTLCNNAQAYQNVKSWGISGRIEYDLDFATISSITGIRRHDERNCADLDATGADIQNACGVPYTRQFTQELQIASSGNGPLRYVAGIFYLSETSANNFTVEGSGINGAFSGLYDLFAPGTRTRPIALTNIGGIEVDSIAPFAQVDYDISEKFSVSAGLRYTSERKRVTSNFGTLAQVSPDGIPIPSTYLPAPLGPCNGPAAQAQTGGSSLCVASPDEIKFNKLTPKLTLSYKPSDRVLIYVTATRGFKSGGFNMPAFGTVPSVRPETLDDFEIGFKAETRNIRFNAAAFYYDYKDLQVSLVDARTGANTVRNAASARVWGLEGDLTWVPVAGLELGAGGGYTNSKYKNFVGDAYVPCGQVASLPAATPAEVAGKAGAVATCAGGGGFGLALVSGRTLSGNRLVNTPEFSGYIRAQYTQPLNGSGQITVSSILNYRSKAYFDSANRFEDRARALLSARVQWTSEGDKYFLAVYGENFTGQKYFVTQQPQNVGGWQTQGAPRQVFVSGGFKF